MYISQSRVEEPSKFSIIFDQFDTEIGGHQRAVSECLSGNDCRAPARRLLEEPFERVVGRIEKCDLMEVCSANE